MKTWSVKNMGIVDAGDCDGKYWVYSVTSPTGEMYRVRIHALNKEFFTYEDTVYKCNYDDMTWDRVTDKDEYRKVIQQIHDSIMDREIELIEKERQLIIQQIKTQEELTKLLKELKEKLHNMFNKKGVD
jgi:TRAP-type C4-dicarboxylate transport system substrate-binding protein